MALDLKDVSTKLIGEYFFQPIEEANEAITNSFFIQPSGSNPSHFKIEITAHTKKLKPVFKYTVTVEAIPKKQADSKKDKIIIIRCAIMAALISLFKLLSSNGATLDPVSFLRIPPDEEIEEGVDNSFSWN